MSSPAYVQSKSGDLRGGTTQPVTFTTGPTLGNLIVASFWYISTSTFTPPTNYLVARHTQQGGADSPLYNIWIGYKVAGASESATVTGTLSPGSNQFGVIHEYSPGAGQTWTSPLDVSAATLNSYSTITSQTTGTTAATAQNDAVAFACAVHPTSLNATGRAWSNSFTTREDVTSLGTFSADKILTATGAQSSTFSWTETRSCGAAIVVFKPTAAAERQPRNPAANFQDPALFMRAWRGASWRRRRSGIVVPEPRIALA